MEEKLQELLYGHETLLAFSASHELYEDASLDQYLEEGYEIIPCGGLSSFWKNIKQFVKEHKKEIIIGTILVVAAVTVTAGVLAVHAASSSEFGSLQSSSSTKNSTPLPTDKETPALAEILEESAAAFKAQVIEEEFFDLLASGESLSPEETGRVALPAPTTISISSSNSPTHHNSEEIYIPWKRLLLTPLLSSVQ